MTPEQAVRKKRLEYQIKSWQNVMISISYSHITCLTGVVFTDNIKPVRKLVPKVTFLSKIKFIDIECYVQMLWQYKCTARSILHVIQDNRWYLRITSFFSKQKQTKFVKKLWLDSTILLNEVLHLELLCIQSLVRWTETLCIDAT